MATARDMLVDLMVTVKADQESAFQELSAYLQSTEAQNFRATIANTQARTIPGGSHDQVLSGLLNIFDAVLMVTNSEIQRQIALQNTSDVAADRPVVPDAPVVVVPDEPIPDDAPVPPEAPVTYEELGPLPADTDGGETA